MEKRVDSRADTLSVVLNRLQHLFNDSCVLSVGSSTSIKLNLKSSRCSARYQFFNFFICCVRIYVNNALTGRFMSPFAIYNACGRSF